MNVSPENFYQANGVMKRLTGITTGFLVACYLALWVYQLGYTDGRDDATDVYKTANRRLLLQVLELSGHGAVASKYQPAQGSDLRVTPASYDYDQVTGRPGVMTDFSE